MGVLKKSSVWAINGVPMFEPSQNVGFELTSISAEGSGRSADGIMHNRFVRTGMRKFSITYSAISAEELAELIAAAHGQEVQLRFLDPPTNSVQTGTFYSADLSATLYSSILYDGLYRNVSIDFVEV